MSHKFDDSGIIEKISLLHNFDARSFSLNKDSAKIVPLKSGKFYIKILQIQNSNYQLSR